MESRYKNYILVFLLLALSTMPFFKESVGFYSMLLAVVLLFKPVLKIEAVIFLVFLMALELYHFFYFPRYDLWVVRQILFYFFVAMYTTYYTRLTFLPIFIHIIYFFTCISFVFFFTYLISPPLVRMFADAVPGVFVKTAIVYENNYKIINPIFFNFDFNFWKGRNNGPFWEPTVFASMLVIAQIFNFILTKQLFNKEGKVFTLGIATTLSTTGFFAYFILILSYFLLSNKVKLFYKIFFCSSFLFIGTYLFTTLPFLQEKINSEIAGVEEEIEEKGGNSRIASATLDMKEVTQEDIYLLLGKGSSRYSRIGTPDKSVLRNCGITALLIEWGLLFFLVYLSLLFYSFLQLTKLFQLPWLMAVVFTLIIIVLSFSEVFFSLPLFHAFIFIGFVVKRIIVSNQASSTKVLAVAA
jgi:hypothetical protein